MFSLPYIITFKHETPASHPKYQKTWIVPLFPFKTSAKYYHLLVWVQAR